MKKFFMIAIMAVAALTASAQKGEVKFSAHAGAGYVNVSNLEFQSPVSKNETNDFSSSIGALLGVECEYMVSDNFGLSAGLDYFYAKSNEISQETLGTKYHDMYFTHSMVNIPILAQYHFGKFAVKAGLQPGFTVAAELSMNGNTATIGPEGADKEYKDYLNSFNLSLPVGLSLDCGASTTLDLRCAIPLTKMNKESFYNNGKDAKMLSIMLTLGYGF